MDDFDLGDLDSSLDLTADSALSDLHLDCCDQSDTFSQSLIAGHIANDIDLMQVLHHRI